MTRRKQVSGQLTISGYEQPSSPMPELVKSDQRIAFGRLVMPYFFDLKEADYQDITPDMVQAADPMLLFLPNVLPTHGGRFTVDGVALDSDEFERIVRSPGSFNRSVTNTTDKAHRMQQIGRRNDASRRSGLHALEQKLPKMEATAKAIAYEKNIIGILAHEAASPGYAHKHAGDMLSMATFVKEIVFGRMLTVVGREKQWTDEQADLANRSVEYRLFFMGKERVGNWRRMLRAADIYAEQRMRLFDDRIVGVGRMILELTPTDE